ncbi:MAG: hypothetical protein Q9215_004458 [Flavoplaca cf. flavocitrina]
MNDQLSNEKVKADKLLNVRFHFGLVSRAGVGHAIFWRRLPFCIRLRWPLWAFDWLVRRMVELLWLPIRYSFHVRDLWQTTRHHVRTLPSRIRTSGMHALIGYLLVTWATCFVVLFFNRALPMIEKLSVVVVVGGVFVTIMVCAIMPSVKGKPYASNEFVWRKWENETGWTSNGFVFMAGCLNGAYGIGTPDVVTHMCEELPRPSRNVPKAILFQNLIGVITTLLFLITIFYALDDLEAVVGTSATFPLTEIYRQATGSAGGALGLIIVIFISSFVCTIAGYITCGRTLWAISRDDAVPFSKMLSRIHPTKRNPFNATLTCGVLCTLLSCIFVASTTAFNAFVGSFVIFSTLSYLAAILPHLLSRRSNVEPGEFWMGGWAGYAVHSVSCLYIMAFIVIFCFPFTLPVDAVSMNYASLITGGVSVFVIGWWFVKRGTYKGPQFVARDNALLAKDAL